MGLGYRDRYQPDSQFRSRVKVGVAASPAHGNGDLEYAVGLSMDDSVVLENYTVRVHSLHVKLVGSHGDHLNPQKKARHLPC